MKKKRGAILSEYVHTDSCFRSQKKGNNVRWNVNQHRLTRANNVDPTEGKSVKGKASTGHVHSSRLTIHHIALAATRGAPYNWIKAGDKATTTDDLLTKAWFPHSQPKLEKNYLLQIVGQVTRLSGTYMANIYFKSSLCMSRAISTSDSCITLSFVIKSVLRSQLLPVTKARVVITSETHEVTRKTSHKETFVMLKEMTRAPLPFLKQSF